MRETFHKDTSKDRTAQSPEPTILSKVLVKLADFPNTLSPIRRETFDLEHLMRIPVRLAVKRVHRSERVTLIFTDFR